MKTALITGGSSGIGLAAAKQLAEKGFNLLLIARTQSKLDAAKADIASHYPDITVETTSLDLSDFAAVRDFADALVAGNRSIDALVLNAGSYPGGQYQMGASGYEMMISTTHLGHFLLAHKLLPLLDASEQPRIVVTSSIAHRFAWLDVSSFNTPKYNNVPYLGTFWGYAQSKLANILFVRGLAERLKAQGIPVNCFHPGVVDTGIFDHLPKTVQKSFELFLISPARAAQTLVYLASDASLNETGEYFYKGKVRRVAKPARSEANVEMLWSESERILADFL